MRKQLWILSVVAALGMVLPAPGFSQELAKEAFATFAPGAIRVEYFRPSSLRTLPDYSALRQRYVGERLRALEGSFAQLGVREEDVDEVMLAWRPGASQMEMDGLVAGKFTAQSVTSAATANNVAITQAGGLPAYCLGTSDANTCFAVLQDSLGIFGSEAALAAMLDAREARAPALRTDARLSGLVSEAPAQAPIWGVAIGAAVPDFFRAWLPAQGNVQLDWAKAFQSVEALVYSVDTADNVRLDVKLDCTNDQSAESTRQVFEGLRMVQQMAWQNMNPGKPNPFQSVELARDGRRLSLKMTTSYSDLTGFGLPGSGGF